MANRGACGRCDRGGKASLYASAGISDYWVLDLPERVLEVHRDPGPVPGQPFGAHYRTISRHPAGTRVRPTEAPRDVAVGDLHPEP